MAHGRRCLRSGCLTDATESASITVALPSPISSATEWLTDATYRYHAAVKLLPPTPHEQPEPTVKVCKTSGTICTMLASASQMMLSSTTDSKLSVSETVNDTHGHRTVSHCWQPLDEMMMTAVSGDQFRLQMLRMFSQCCAAVPDARGAINQSTMLDIRYFEVGINRINRCGPL